MYVGNECACLISVAVLCYDGRDAVGAVSDVLNAVTGYYLTAVFFLIPPTRAFTMSFPWPFRRHALSAKPE